MSRRNLLTTRTTRNPRPIVPIHPQTFEQYGTTRDSCLRCWNEWIVVDQQVWMPILLRSLVHAESIRSLVAATPGRKTSPPRSCRRGHEPWPHWNRFWTRRPRNAPTKWRSPQNQQSSPSARAWCYRNVALSPPWGSTPIATTWKRRTCGRWKRRSAELSIHCVDHGIPSGRSCQWRPDEG